MISHVEVYSGILTTRVQRISLGFQTAQVLRLLVYPKLCGFNLGLIVGLNAAGGSLWAYGDWHGEG